jgi:hypothetical protein
LTSYQHVRPDCASIALPPNARISQLQQPWCGDVLIDDFEALNTPTAESFSVAAGER